jgi:hypothetical protein
MLIKAIGYIKRNSDKIAIYYLRSQNLEFHLNSYGETIR